MSTSMPAPPAGSGEHPIALVVISANEFAASCAFYSKVFGWHVQALSPELAIVLQTSGPAAALRANVPDGFPGVVPFVRVRDVDGALAQVVSLGSSLERATWSLPMVGKLARFSDESGTIYGLTDAAAPGGTPPVPMPFGSNPKPPASSICSLEMYTASADAAPSFCEMFGWGTLPTMPQFRAYDPGAGIGGVFQSHTPALPAVAYLYSDDVEAKLAELASAGGQKIGEAMRVPGMACFGYFKDPSGTTMGLIGP